MPSLKFLLLLITVCITDAASVHTDDHRWIAPSATDERSPCPGLNILANHGYLPRNGKDISIPMIIDAAKEGFNLAPDTVVLAAKLGLLSNSTATTTLNLEALKLHGLIESDASLSRGDFALGDNLHFNETIFSTLANANPGVDYYNITSAGQVMHERLAISLATNPNVTNTPKEIVLRSGTSAFYLMLMGDAFTGVAPKKFVQIFFREERLPIAEGWKRSNVSLNGTTMEALSVAIQAASKWTATQECETLVLAPTV
ncbi:Chloroperoxidase [Mycena albidolilacea]|uniref:Chloroperoxidase n=1 Tax=Mycena albidolilacea TaxID=1033008 RepID=A0AAD6Z9J2_9AGAR|nr:Chloroperoxidase [Mycena albidolilacea]